MVSVSSGLAHRFVRRYEGGLTRTPVSAMMAAVPPLPMLIRQELDRLQVHPVEESVFGSADPEVMVAVLERYCRHQVGAGVADGLFYLTSAGCVFGVRLESGDDVVVKAYQERWTAPYLRAVHAVQAHLWSAGFPCARPLASPSPLQAGRPNVALAVSYLHDPGMVPLQGSEDCRQSAVGLARQVSLCRALNPDSALAEHPLRAATGRLYPEPHSPIFDFELASAATVGIDHHATGASVLREADRSPPVIAHTDWSARNVRLGAGGLVAAYDWDSLALVPESRAVGQAAATWSVTAEPGGSEFPSLESITEFVLRYEEAAGRLLDEVQWRATGAAAAYVLAYTARCEDSLESVGLARADQRGARDRLAEAGERLLTFTRP